jgi:hypothetical protein
MFGKIIFLGGVVYILAFGAAVIQDATNPEINQQLAMSVAHMDNTRIASEPSTPQNGAGGRSSNPGRRRKGHQRHSRSWWR